MVYFTSLPHTTSTDSCYAIGGVAPVVTSITPSNAPTTGDTVATIRGYNFGVSRTVRAGNTILTQVGAGSHTTVVVTIPPAAGSYPITVTVAGRNNSVAPMLTYDAPVFINQTNFPPTQGGLVTFNGRNFGTDSIEFGTLLIRPFSAASDVASLVRTQFMFQATVPAGAGVQLSGRITVAGVPSSLFTFVYASPTITSVRSLACAGFSGPWSFGCDPRGGYEITINGANFGSSEAPIGGSGAIAVTVGMFSPTFCCVSSVLLVIGFRWSFGCHR
jgi:hypothetical protein